MDADARSGPVTGAARPGHSALTPIADVALLPVANPVFLAVGVMLASLLQILDSTIANVALPRMQSTLGANPDQISWVLTSYIIATAVAMPVTGWLADRVGSRRLFLFSVSGFVLSSMLCGMAQSLEQMVLFRALQGATGAFIAPLSQAAMIDTNPPSRQPQMMALWGVGIMVGPVLGPILGGWLTENWNWRWVFYVNVPLGAVALTILYSALPSRRLIKRNFDLLGFATIGIALTSVQMLLDRGHQVDWFDSGEILIYLGIAVSAAWIAALRLATADQPLFPRDLFGDRNFAVALLIMVLVGVSMFATMALMPPMLQHLFGYSVIDTGLVLTPRGIGTLVAMQASGWLVRKGVDARILIATGFAIGGWSMLEMSSWSLAVDRFHIVWTGLMQGFGMGMVFIPLNTSAFATLPPSVRTDGSSLLNIMRSVGSSVGISVAMAVLARNQQVSHGDLAGHVTGSMSGLIDVTALDRFQDLGDAAMRMIDLEVYRQALMIAFINDFYLMAWINFAGIPLVLLMRKAGLRSGPGP